MSYLSLADNSLTIGSLPLPVVKSLILGDEEQFAEHPSIRSVSGGHWGVFRNRFNAKTHAALSAGEIKTTKLDPSAITNDQLKALTEGRRLVRSLLSQNIALSSEAAAALENSEVDLVAQETISNILKEAAFRESDEFWSDHLTDARFEIQTNPPRPEDHDHMKTILGSFTRSSPSIYLDCLNANAAVAAGSVVQPSGGVAPELLYWNMLRSNWAASVRDSLKAELGVDLRTLSPEEGRAVLQSEEGIKASHWASSVVLGETLSFIKLAKHRSSSHYPDAPNTGVEMLQAKLAEVDTLVSQGKLKSYKSK